MVLQALTEIGGGGGWGVAEGVQRKKKQFPGFKQNA